MTIEKIICLHPFTAGQGYFCLHPPKGPFAFLKFTLPSKSLEGIVSRTNLTERLRLDTFGLKKKSDQSIY